MAACSFTPQELLDESSCFNCLQPGQLQLVIVELLCKIMRQYNPMATCDPNTLLDEAKCFNCLQPGQLQLVTVKLLCEIRDHIGTPSGVGCLFCGDSDPVDAPTGGCTCAMYYNSTSGGLWYWNDALSVWTQLIGG